MKLPIKAVKTALVKYTKMIPKLMVKESPTILAGIGVVGVVSVAVTTHTATKKAVEKMEEVRSEDDYVEPETKVDAAIEEVKETWQYYIPVGAIMVVAIVAIVQGNRISLRRISILTDAYRMSEKLRKEYQTKVKEVLGENKEAKIQNEIAQDRLDEDPVDEKYVYATGHGNSLIKDCFSGRYFYSNPEFIRQVKNQLDRKLVIEDYISVNELFYKLDLEMLDAAADYGWRVDHCDMKDLTDIRLIPGTASDGRPCHVLTYEVELGFDVYEDS